MIKANRTPEGATSGNDAYMDEKQAQFDCGTVADDERMFEDIRLSLKEDAILRLAIYHRDRENAKATEDQFGTRSAK